MLTPTNAHLIAQTAVARPNGADQAHGYPKPAKREAQELPAPTRIAPEDDLPLCTLRPLFIVVIVTAAAAGFIACSCSLPRHLFGF